MINRDLRARVCLFMCIYLYVLISFCGHNVPCKTAHTMEEKCQLTWGHITVGPESKGDAE